jgi:Lon protease-like protein
MSQHVVPQGKFSVAVFPLPRLVMFPGTILPLHIFELRYREMLRACLESGDKLLAVTQLKPGWEPNYEGNPPIYSVAGVGAIEGHRENPDGTYDIVLRALARVRLAEDTPQRQSYRQATALVLRERTPERVDRNELAAVVSLATNIAAIVKRALPGFALQTTHDDGPGLLSDRLADQFVLDPEARQDLLETLDVAARLRALTNHLAQLHLALCSTTQSGSSSMH